MGIWHTDVAASKEKAKSIIVKKGKTDTNKKYLTSNTLNYNYFLVSFILNFVLTEQEGASRNASLLIEPMKKGYIYLIFYWFQIFFTT